MNLELLQKNLEARGFTYRYFDTAQQAADYLVNAIQGKTVGIGGSMTIQSMGLYERLKENNQVAWHWEVPGLTSGERLLAFSSVSHWPLVQKHSLPTNYLYSNRR